MIGLKEIMEFFGAKLGEFSKEWRQLTEQDRTQIRAGIEDGTFTY